MTEIMMNCMRYVRVIPSVMNRALKAPKVPEVSIGRIYFMMSGMNVLYNPEHTPWQNLQMKSKAKCGIRIRMLAINATIVVTKRHYLNNIQSTFLKSSEWRWGLKGLHSLLQNKRIQREGHRQGFNPCLFWKYWL